MREDGDKKIKKYWVKLHVGCLCDIHVYIYMTGISTTQEKIEVTSKRERWSNSLVTKDSRLIMK